MKRDLDSIILTRQELQIMKVVWKLGKATVKQVRDTIAEKKPTAYTTILTLMGILEEKGVLIHSKTGRSFLYKPLLSHRQATHNQVRDLIERFFEGNPEKLAKYLRDKGAVGLEGHIDHGNQPKSAIESQVA
ncbi:MAG TPA: BlaI/MecI/CopY family transcriptional regulator [Acidobacteriota bacterium]|nr:BlaI/MecI/CopY family transcriptional regulator [Acidobacteriota bacterium]